nr:hypothetical protein [Candidatus Njordarchaeota archaeon]
MSEAVSPQQRNLLLVLKCFGGHVRGIKRLQKLIFLAQREGALENEARLVFAPYLRGPFSTECMDVLNDLSSGGYIQIRRISDNASRGYHEIRLTEKGNEVVKLLHPNQNLRNFAEKYSCLDTEGLTEESYREFYKTVTPTMLYINIPAIDEVTCYPSSPHWRSAIGERIKLVVPISKTVALDQNDVEKIERIRDKAAVFTSTNQVLDDWKTRKIVPGCIIRTYGVFHDARQASLGIIGKFSHNSTSAANNAIDVLMDAFGKIFFIDCEAETLLSYVVELCGEVGVSVTYPIINALYILGYDVLPRVREDDRTAKRKGANLQFGLGFRRADQDLDPSPMFT